MFLGIHKVGGALKLFSEWFEWYKRVSIFNIYKKKIVWQFDVMSHLTSDLRVYFNIYAYHFRETL